VELTGVRDVAEDVAMPLGIVPVVAELELLALSAALVRIVELLDVHARHATAQDPAHRTDDQGEEVPGEVRRASSADARCWQLRRPARLAHRVALHRSIAKGPALAQHPSRRRARPRPG